MQCILETSPSLCLCYCFIIWWCGWFIPVTATGVCWQEKKINKNRQSGLLLFKSRIWICVIISANFLSQYINHLSTPISYHSNERAQPTLWQTASHVVENILLEWNTWNTKSIYLCAINSSSPCPANQNQCSSQTTGCFSLNEFFLFILI